MTNCDITTQHFPCLFSFFLAHFHFIPYINLDHRSTFRVYILTADMRTVTIASKCLDCLSLCIPFIERIKMFTFAWNGSFSLATEDKPCLAQSSSSLTTRGNSIKQFSTNWEFSFVFLLLYVTPCSTMICNIMLETSLTLPVRKQSDICWHSSSCPKLWFYLAIAPLNAGEASGGKPCRWGQLLAMWTNHQQHKENKIYVFVFSELIYDQRTV